MPTRSTAPKKTRSRGPLAVGRLVSHHMVMTGVLFESNRSCGRGCQLESSRPVQIATYRPWIVPTRSIERAPRPPTRSCGPCAPPARAGRGSSWASEREPLLAHHREAGPARRLRIVRPRPRGREPRLRSHVHTGLECNAPAQRGGQFLGAMCTPIKGKWVWAQAVFFLNGCVSEF